MEKATDLTCIICCSSDCEDFQGLTFHLSGEEDAEEEVNRDGWRTNEKWIFKQFCSQLLSIQSLELERSLSVCSPCLESITWTVETKSKVDAVEGRVRKLQRSILMELKELQGCMASLEGELKKIEDSVRRSSGETNMFGHRKMSRMKRGQMEICEDENDAVIFRKSISDVATNLRMFCGDLSSRFPVGGFGVSIKRSASVLGFDEVNNVEEMDNFECLPSQPYSDDECHNLEAEDVDSTADRQEIGYGNEVNEAYILPDEDDFQFRNKKNKQLVLSESDVDSNNDDDDDNSSISPDFEQLTDVDLSSKKDQQRFRKDRSKALAFQLSKSSQRRGKKHKLKPTSKQYLSTTDDSSCEDAEHLLPLTSALKSIDNSSKSPRSKSAAKDLLLKESKSKLGNASSDSEDDDTDTLKNIHQDMINSPRPSRSSSLTLKGRKSFKGPRPRSRKLMKKLLSSDDHDHDDSNDIDQKHIDDDNETEYWVYEGGPNSPASSSENNSKEEPKVKFVRNPALMLIDFSDMSEFKQYVIRSLLNKLIAQFGEIPDGDESSNQNSAEHHLRQAEQERLSTVIEYDPYSDKVLVKGVEIFINESEKTVECGECQYKISVQWPAQPRKERNNFVKNGKRCLKAHILSAHHWDFNCPLCPPDITTGYKLEPYIVHLKTHMNAHPHVCSICGRPVSSDGSLITHLRTHMNAEEKAEAIMLDGKIKNPSSHNKPKRPKKNKTVLCPVCGKAVKQLYFKKHLANVCGVPEGAPRIKCHFCEKTFKHKGLVKRHIDRTHSEDAKNRPYRCHICPSSFKVKWDLSHHMKIHVEERIYKCDKGCGRDFATKRNCKRHQDNCKGVQRIKRTND